MQYRFFKNGHCNLENSKTFDTRSLMLNFVYKINLKVSNKYHTLRNLGIYNTRKNITKFNKNNKFNLPGPTWDEKFELLHGSYSAADI